MKQGKTKTKKRSEHHLVGEIGEELACRFLSRKGFKIVEQNYLKKWGEIDIIAQKKGILHFIEVKSVKEMGVSRETIDGEYRPEDNVHPKKLKRLGRAIQTYLLERGVSYETLWQFDVVTVKINLESKHARVKMLEDLVI